MFCLPIPLTSAFASVCASLTLPASRLTPRISREFSSVSIACAICSHLGVSVYVTPPGFFIPGTGHQVQSVESPPKRSTGDWLGAIWRIRFRNAGLTDFRVRARVLLERLVLHRQAEEAGRQRPGVDVAAVAAGVVAAVDGGTVVAAGVAGGSVVVVGRRAGCGPGSVCWSFADPQPASPDASTRAMAASASSPRGAFG